jgi:alpha-mannosidase
MFFSRWWAIQDDETKENFRTLVKEGRWEFVSGGWVASDEACPSFQDFLENIIVGHDFLMREFGVNPKIAWHVDAFGHSMGSAEMFLDLGYEALFFARMDDAERSYRKKTKQMEFMWHPSYTNE